MRRHAAGVALAILVAVIGGSGVVAAAASRGAPRPDVMVSLSSGDRCGKFRDSLPPLVLEQGVQPGASTRPLVVCVTNRGPANGRLSLVASSMVETDPACTGGEASVDGSCGVGVGEAGSAMVQHVALDPACKRDQPPASSHHQAGPLAGLDDAPVTLSTTLRPEQVVCVALWLVASAEPAIATAAQSDVVTWRYGFVLEAT